MKEKLGQTFSAWSTSEMEILLEQLTHKRISVEQVLREIIEKQHQSKQCTVCTAPLTKENYTLEFGPGDLRQRARFCAHDCLSYFLIHTRGAQNAIVSTQE